MFIVYLKVIKYTSSVYDVRTYWLAKDYMPVWIRVFLIVICKLYLGEHFKLSTSVLVISAVIPSGFRGYQFNIKEPSFHTGQLNADHLVDMVDRGFALTLIKRFLPFL